MGSHKQPVKRFISEPITVRFKQAPAYLKKPSCPDFFTWQNQEYQVTACLAEWKDFTRRGKMAHNMQPQHLETAKTHGSWGVGRFYFDISTRKGPDFRLYYQRTPKNASDREGQWILFAELSTGEN